jgi:alginate O-acetyltransferase complex protein AlgI
LSFFFYFWSENWFIAVLLTSAFIDYICGLVLSGAFGNNEPIKKLERGGKRTKFQKGALIVSIITNLSILGFFKYTNFGISNFNMLMGVLGADSLKWNTTLKIILPLGISFYTFQSMSYTFDIYLGNTKATRNVLNYVTYIIMFPQLVAGPIIRYRDVARQLVERVVTRDGISYGIRRFVVGMGKKVLIANTLAVPVNRIFEIPFSQLTPGLTWLGLFAFSLQIYYDFSGYSDMAIGLGSILGFKFRENFRYPFVAVSGTDYFQRWHISLNSWLRDYPYRAMGGSRGRAFRVYFNVIFLLILVGLWHGANWNFILWGFYCGILLAIQRYMIRNNLSSPVPKIIKVIFCFFLFMTSMAFFRAESMTQAFVFLKGIFGFVHGDGLEYHASLYLTPKIIFILIVGYLGSLPLVPWINSIYGKFHSRCSPGIAPFVEGAFLAARLVCIMAIFAASAMTLAAETHSPFIYFRF